MFNGTSSLAHYDAGNTGSVHLITHKFKPVANPLADAEGLFGTDLAGTPQGHVVIGAANDDSGAINSGKVFVFDGGNGDLIKVIGNPSPAANVNFGQGIGVTSAGQIAVGAFGADGGFGTLHLFTSISAGEDLSLLNKQPFADPNLQSCVLGQAAANGWATVSEVSGLDCSDSAISDLTGLDALVMACWRRKPRGEVIVHSDQGCQYTSYDWRSMLKGNGLIASMSRKGNCHNKAVAESFFQLLKRERIRKRIYPN